MLSANSSDWTDDSRDVPLMEDNQSDGQEGSDRPSPDTSVTNFPVRAWLEGALDGMVLLDAANQVVDANTAACEIFGLSRDGLIGRAIAELIESESDRSLPWRSQDTSVRVTGALKLRCLDQVKSGEYAFTVNVLPGLSLLTLRGVGRSHRDRAISHLTQELLQLNQSIEQKVNQRTSALQQAYDQLQAELQMRQQAEAMLRQNEAKLAAFESTLKRITDRVRDSLDENQILHSAVEELARILHIRSCNAALFNLEQGTSTICYEYTTSSDVPSHGRVSKIADFPEIYQQILQGLHFQFCSLMPNPRRGRAAMLCCPMLDDQGVLGDLWLVNQANDSFAEQDIRLVQQVANQCAIALRQAKLYQSSQSQVQELERLHQLKDDFLSTVSHELRTPMANIKLATQMLDIALKEEPTSLSSGSSRVNHYLTILKDECQREINLINDLLDLSRLDEPNSTLTLVQINLYEWLIRFVEPFIERTRSQQQQFRLSVSSTLPPCISDMAYLERLLSELLTNACKYTPVGGTIELAVRAVNQDEGSQIMASSSSLLVPHLPFLEMTVTNTGIEIPDYEHDRIFEKFYRIPSSDPWRYGGTGLGLALVKKLAERLGGTLTLESENGQTAFILCLPLVIV